MEARVPDLIKNAGSLKALGERFRNQSRIAVAAARKARQRGDEEGVRECVGKARVSWRKARKCADFAIVCERRAEKMA